MMPKNVIIKKELKDQHGHSPKTHKFDRENKFWYSIFHEWGSSRIDNIAKEIVVTGTS
jgi:hypothetical protein